MLMSYDVYFFKQLKGKTLVETFDSLTPDKNGYIDPDSEIDPREIANALLALKLGFVETASIDKSIELNIADPEEVPIRIIIDTSMVGIALPYWEVSIESVNELKWMWTAIVPTLTKFELVGYDTQTMSEVDVSSVEQMTISMAQGTKDLAEAVAAIHKPWWHLW
jgi:hypothetical protein